MWTKNEQGNVVHDAGLRREHAQCPSGGIYSAPVGNKIRATTTVFTWHCNKAITWKFHGWHKCCVVLLPLVLLLAPILSGHSSNWAISTSLSSQNDCMDVLVASCNPPSTFSGGDLYSNDVCRSSYWRQHSWNVGALWPCPFWWFLVRIVTVRLSSVLTVALLGMVLCREWMAASFNVTYYTRIA